MPEHGPFCPIFYFREPHFAHFLRKFVRIFSTCRPIHLLSMLIHSCFKLDFEQFNFSNLLTLCKFMPKCTALFPMILHDPQGIGFPGVYFICIYYYCLLFEPFTVKNACYNYMFIVSIVA